jgi:hypothetical protein
VRANGTWLAALRASLQPDGERTMPDTRRPSGPGRPSHEKHDAVAEREELNELASGQRDDDQAAQPDPGIEARHAERAAHGGADKEAKRRR